MQTENLRTSLAERIAAIQGMAGAGDGRAVRRIERAVPAGRRAEARAAIAEMAAQTDAAPAAPGAVPVRVGSHTPLPRTGDERLDVVIGVLDEFFAESYLGRYPGRVHQRFARVEFGGRKMSLLQVLESAGYRTIAADSTGRYPALDEVVTALAETIARSRDGRTIYLKSNIPKRDGQAASTDGKSFDVGAFLSRRNG